MKSTDDHLKAYRTHLTGRLGLKPSSAENYFYALRSLERFLEAPAADATDHDLEEFAASMKVRNLAANTQRLRLIALRTYYDWQRPGKPNPISRISIPHEEVKDPMLITPNELVQIVVTASIPPHHDKNTEQGKFVAMRNAAIICVLADTGIRESELVNLTMSSIAQEKDHFKLIARGKTGERIIPFSKMTENSLIAEYWTVYWQYRRLYMKAKPADPLFIPQDPSSKRIVNRHMHRGGVYTLVKRLIERSPVDKPLYPHALRHFYGTYAVVNGTSMEILRQRMGHASIETTTRYVHLADLYGDPQLDKGPTSGLMAPREHRGFVKIQKELDRSSRGR